METYDFSGNSDRDLEVMILEAVMNPSLADKDFIKACINEQHNRRKEKEHSHGKTSKETTGQ